VDLLLKTYLANIHAFFIFTDWQIKNMKKFAYIFSLLLFVVSYSFSQVNENFSDGEFNINPTWNGDVSSFTVINEQLRSNNQIANSTYYLSTPSTLATEAQWEIFVNLQFATSGSNYVDVYLTSDVQDLNTPNNGYFVRVGNTTDEISLNKVSSGVVAEIIDGADGAVSSSSNNLIKLKVTRDVANNWTLKRDITGTGNSFFTEGSVVDNSFSSSSFFGIYVKQSTASFFLKHFFDDIVVQPIVLDTEGPVLLSSSLESPNTVDLLFSESVSAGSASLITNYSLSPATTSIISAELDPINSSLVHLTLSNNLTSSTVYEFIVSNIEDEAGNILQNSPVTKNFYIAGLFDLLINEIMADPTPLIGLPDAEYFEIYNKTNQNINLKNYKFSHGTTIRTFPDVTINAGTYTIVTAPINTSLFSGNVIGLENLSTSALSNTGTPLSISNSLNEIVHQVNYSDQWYADENKIDGGWSLELIDANNPCAGSSNWVASNSITGGTPGQLNTVNAINPDVVAPKIIAVSPLNANTLKVYFSEPILTNTLNSTLIYTVNNSIGNPSNVIIPSLISDNITLNFSNVFNNQSIYNLSMNFTLADCAGNLNSNLVSPDFSLYGAQFLDVVINEIMADPDPSQGLPSGEFIELFNRTPFPINARNWKFKYGSTEKIIDYGTIPANGYALITAPSVVAIYQPFYSILSCGTLSNSGFLTNSGTILNISDSLGNLISTITYSDSWYKDNTKSGGGFSLEQIDPNNSCAGIKNWAASNAQSGGTPGNVNSIFSNNPDNVLPKISSVCIDGNSLKITFSELVKTASLDNLQIFSVNNSIGNPNSILFSTQVVCSSIDLLFDSVFSNDLVYTLTISALISDCVGNQTNNNSSYDFTNKTPNEYEIVINEIMADPDPVVGLPSAEYIEIYNKTSIPFSLKDYQLQTGNASGTIGCVSIAANDYLILTAANNVESFTELGNTSDVGSFSLSNEGSIVVLRTPSGKVISSVEYTANWHQSTIKADGGWALEQVDANNPCGGETNWKSSIDLIGGTPGKVNSVNASNPDITNPVLLRAYPVNSNTLRISFNESLNPNFTIDNFFGDNGLGNPVSINPIAPIFTSILLQFNSNFQTGVIYTITVNNPIKDCVGNQLTEVKTVKFGLPSLPQIGDIVITEILSDPKTDGNDFVEFLNKSSKIIDLKDCRISNYDTTTWLLSSIYPIDSTGFLIFPNQYYVVTKEAVKLKNYYTIPYEENLINTLSFPTLSIDEGTVAISLYNDVIIDKAYYNQEMQFPLLNSAKGVTYEKINLEKPSSQYSNWTSASETSGFGTPTGKNSQDLTQKESDDVLSLSAEFISPDNDGYQDVIEISYNLPEANLVGTLEIYDSKGRIIKTIFQNQLLGINGSTIWDGVTNTNEKSNIGICKVLLTAFDLNGKTKSYKKVLVIAGKI
jgi:hypothetical protein